MLTEALLLEQNKRLREEIEELRETVRQLRERESEASILPPGLPHLTRLEEAALVAIWSRRGIVDKLTIYNDMYAGDSAVDMKIVDVAVCKLRKKLTEPHHPKIITVWGKGYAIGRGQPTESHARVNGEVSQMISETLAA